MSDAGVNAWLRRETPKHLDLLTKLRERLTLTLDDRAGEPDADGNPTTIQADTNDCGTPSRDWCRAYARYQGAYTSLLAEERERYKMQMLAKRAGMATLTDEEYSTEMIELGREAIRELSTEEIQREFLRRGMTLPVPETEGDPA